MTSFAEEMLSKAKAHRSLSANELAKIRQRLRDFGDDPDAGELARALSLSTPSNARDIELIERLLESQDDWVLQGAIMSLCQHWNMLDNYIHRIVDLIDAKKWDDSPDTAIALFSIIGQRLMSSQDSALYNILLSALNEDIKLYELDASSFRPVHFSCCFQAIDLGVRGEESLLRPIRVTNPSDVPQDIVAIAKHRARMDS